jgi:hypothetical protein
VGDFDRHFAGNLFDPVKIAGASGDDNPSTVNARVSVEHSNGASAP